MNVAARSAGIRRLQTQRTTEQKKIPESRRDSMVNLESTEKTSSTNSLQVPPIARRRSGSIPAVRLSLAVAWGLKPDQCRALRITWSRLCLSPRSSCKGIVAIMDRIFEKFDEKVKSVREIFYNTAFVDSMADHSLRRHSSQSIATLRDHTHFFVSLISQVIQAFDCAPYETLEHIDKIGSSHASLKKYGFKDSMWDKLGELVIDAFVVQDCVRGFPDACRAWTILIAALIDRLRSARINSAQSQEPSTPTTSGIVAVRRIFRSESVTPLSFLRPRSNTLSPVPGLRRRVSRRDSVRSQKCTPVTPT